MTRTRQRESSRTKPVNPAGTVPERVPGVRSMHEPAVTPRPFVASLSRVLGWCALGSVFVLILVLSFRRVSEIDLGFHMRAGEWILTHHQWPQTDPFTYTVTDHPYIDLHWLYQIGLVLLYRLGGDLALVVAHALLIEVAFALVALTAWRHLRSPLALAALLFFGVCAAELRFMLRPEVVTWVLLAFTVFLLDRYALGQPSPLWLLPVIELIWVNTEGLFVLGWAVIGAYWLDRLLEKRHIDHSVTGGASASLHSTQHAARSTHIDRSLTGWGLASGLITLVNPYFLRGVAFPLSLVTRLNKGNPFGQTISEFVSPWSLSLSAATPFYPRWVLLAYYALVVLTIAGFALTWRQRRPREYLLAGAFFVLSAQAIRNVPLFVLIALPILAACLADWLPRLARAGDRPRRKPMRTSTTVAGRSGQAVWTLALAVVLLLLVAGLALRVRTNAYYIADRRVDRFGYQVDPATLPVGAVQFMREHAITGRLFNHLNYGGYLMWQLAEPVFIDGRLEVIGEEFYNQYLTAGQNQKLLSLLDQYDAQVVIFPYLVAQSWERQLGSSPRWRLAYYDEQSAVYLREDANPEIPPLSLPSATPHQLPIPVSAQQREHILYAPRATGLASWLEGFWREQFYPEQELNRGIFNHYLDQYDLAEAYYLDAIQSSQGRYYEIYNNLGSVYFKTHRNREAIRCYQAVLADQPDNELAQNRLAELQGSP